MFKTKMAEITELYESKDKPYIVSTKPYQSHQWLELEVVDRDETNQIAFMVARKGQVLDFFGYGIGERIDAGPLSRKATLSDTNISKAKSTNGAAHMVIEGISLSPRGFRVLQADALTTPPVDTRVLAALAGETPMVDPGSVICPPQLMSPFNLEHAVFSGLLPHLALELVWDEMRRESLGAAGVIPEGGAASLLKASGTPENTNVFAVKEGYVWAPDGQSDSELVVRATLNEDIVFPLTLNEDPTSADAVLRPTTVWLDICCRLHGFEFKHPSKN